MKEEQFREGLNGLVADIESKYCYDHKTLEANITNYIFDNLNIDLSEPDKMEYTLKEIKYYSLKVIISFSKDGKVIQTLNLIV